MSVLKNVITKRPQIRKTEAAVESPASDVDAEYENAEKYIAHVREEFKRNKAAFVADAMNLTPEESATFWRVYADYDKERTLIGDRRLALLEEYAASYEQMTDAKAKGLSEKSYNIQKDLLDLRYRYVKKYQQIMNPIIGARFAQVEQQTQLLLDMVIAANLPLIEKPVE
jgi:hypothetical protein